MPTVALVRCPSCRFESADPEWCDRCGADLRARATEPVTPALVTGTRVGPLDQGAPATDGAATPDLLTLAERKQVHGTRVRWLARDDQGREYLVIDDPLSSAEPEPSPLPGVWAPLATLTHGGHRLRVFALPSGVRLRSLLESAPHPMPRVLALTQHLATAVRALHAEGRALLAPSLDDVYLEHFESEEHTSEPARVTFAWDGPFPAFDAARPALTPARGFSPPEAYGRGEGKLVPASDVYVLGALAYYLATGAPLVPDIAESGTELPPPCDYAPGIEPGLGPIVRRATARLASRRYASVAELEAQLLAAAQRSARRTAPAAVRHVLAADGHVGLAKGRANPITEDAAFFASTPDRKRTLAAVFDGVTHARLGSGHTASQLAVQVFAERWARLQQSQLFTRDEPLPPRVAQNLLESLLRAANDAIVARANELADTLTAEAQPAPNEVMATTAVVALLDGPRLCIANLGDSRAYVALAPLTAPDAEPRGLERLTADHDVAHELLRERRPLAVALTAKGGSQLTRFLGRLAPREDGPGFKAVAPDPDIHHHTLLPGERLLLCSDGLSDYVAQADAEGDAAIARVLSEHRDGARAAFELVVLANRGGGGDNVTCVVIDLVASP